MERTHQSLGFFIPAIGLALCLGSKAGAAPPLEAYGNLPQVEYMRVAPSGARVAMVGVIGEKRQLVLAEVAGGKVLKAAAIGTNKVRDLSWAGDEHVLVWITATTAPMYDFGFQRYELSGALHVGLDQTPPWSVFEHSDNIEHTVFDVSTAPIRRRAIGPAISVADRWCDSGASGTMGIRVSTPTLTCIAWISRHRSRPCWQPAPGGNTNGLSVGTAASLRMSSTRRAAANGFCTREPSASECC